MEPSLQLNSQHIHIGTCNLQNYSNGNFIDDSRQKYNFNHRDLLADKIKIARDGKKHGRQRNIPNRASNWSSKSKCASLKEQTDLNVQSHSQKLPRNQGYTRGIFPVSTDCYATQLPSINSFFEGKSKRTSKKMKAHLRQIDEKLPSNFSTTCAATQKSRLQFHIKKASKDQLDHFIVKQKLKPESDNLNEAPRMFELDMVDTVPIEFPDIFPPTKEFLDNSMRDILGNLRLLNGDDPNEESPLDNTEPLKLELMAQVIESPRSQKHATKDISALQLLI